MQKLLIILSLFVLGVGFANAEAPADQNYSICPSADVVGKIAKPGLWQASGLQWHSDVPPPESLKSLYFYRAIITMEPINALICEYAWTDPSDQQSAEPTLFNVELILKSEQVVHPFGQHWQKIPKSENHRHSVKCFSPAPVTCGFQVKLWQAPKKNGEGEAIKILEDVVRPDRL